MTFDTFKSASFEKKCDWIITNSDYLVSVQTDKETTCYLYHSGDYFIEISYSNRKRRVINIQAFNDPEKLVIYTLDISLDSLLD